MRAGTFHAYRTTFPTTYYTRIGTELEKKEKRKRETSNAEVTPRVKLALYTYNNQEFIIEYVCV